MNTKGEMTGRERQLAALTMRPADRLMFHAKLPGNYPAYHGGQTLAEYHGWIGDDPDGFVPYAGKETRTDTGYERRVTPDGTFITYSTKYGSCRAVYALDPASGSLHPAEFPIKTVEDVKIMTAWYRGIVNEIDGGALRRSLDIAKAYGDTCAVHSNIAPPGRSGSPFMHFLEWLAGIMEGQFLLADYPDEVGELFGAMHGDLRAKAALQAEHAPADFLYMSENTSTTILSPAQFEEHCAGRMDEYAGIAHRHGKLFQIHMCGHIKSLLPRIASMKAGSIEALTPPSVGDTDLATARVLCPDKCFLGGTNAVQWVSSPEEVIAYLESQLSRLPHHRGIVLSTGGALPPSCPPEFVRKVAAFVKGYRIQ
jgi:hypothetical protein